MKNKPFILERKFAECLWGDVFMVYSIGKNFEPISLSPLPPTDGAAEIDRG